MEPAAAVADCVGVAAGRMFLDYDRDRHHYFELRVQGSVGGGSPASQYLRASAAYCQCVPYGDPGWHASGDALAGTLAAHPEITGHRTVGPSSIRTFLGAGAYRLGWCTGLASGSCW